MRNLGTLFDHIQQWATLITILPYVLTKFDTCSRSLGK